MSVTRCQECGTPISRRCRRCPLCLARNPAAPRLSFLGILVGIVLLAVAVFLIKQLHFDDLAPVAGPGDRADAAAHR